MKIKRSLVSLVLAAAMLINTACSESNVNTETQTNDNGSNPITCETEEPESQATDDSTNVSEASGFYVDGTALYDANGNQFIMRGINHAHTWFKDQLETAVPAIAATGANTVRIVLSDKNSSI